MTKGWTADDVPSQKGRVAVVTGANSGLGFETAKVLAARGARVVLACRSPERAEGALASLRAACAGAEVEAMALDLADLSSVQAFAREVSSKYEAIGLLVNNAGLMAIPRARTVDGFEMQFGTNHLGHFALTGALLPALGRAPSARVVNVSSYAHRVGSMNFHDLMYETRPYDRWGAYAQSKLANLLFTSELARRLALKGSPVVAVAAHPGYAVTNLQARGAALGGPKLEAFALRAFNAIVAQSAAAGAWPQLRAATDPGARPGDYYGPAGPFEARGPAIRVGMLAAARDPEAARQLWRESARLTGESY
ncbi:MAG TPA: oxidoreductase, partial [Polyangiaceae bacterium]|nr:oxidoreductase [Polyangiaceae bacterium]